MLAAAGGQTIVSELSGSFDFMSLNSLKIIFSKNVIFDDACFNSLKSLSFSFSLLFLNFLRVTHHISVNVLFTS